MKREIIVITSFLLTLKEAKISALSDEFEKFTTINTHILKNQPTSVVIFSCWHKTENLKLLKLWSLNGYQVSIQHIHQEHYNLESLKTIYHKLNVLLDVECKLSNKTLTWASEQELFSKLHKWILFSYQSEENIMMLENLKIPLDSQVTLMYMNNQITLQDVYRLADEEVLKVTSPYVWSLDLPLPLPPRRDNYEGMTIKSALVVVEDVYDEHFLDVTYKHKYHLTNLNFQLATYTSQMLNFRMEVILSDSWGFPINNTSQYTGVIGLLQRGEAEWGALAIIMKIPRLSVIDYSGVPITFGGALMFLKPSLSEITTIYVLPFDLSVWFVSIAMLIILTATLLFLNYAEKRFISLKLEGQENLNCKEAMSLTFGLTCQQGAYYNPKSISTKLVFAIFLLFAMFLYISYSAIIVSLLQTSSNSINTLEQLTDSPFTISMRNASYCINYEHESTAAQIQKLYRTKIHTQPFQEAFTTQEKGIEKVKKGLHAFHGEPDTYKIISDTFEEYEKCRFSEIIMISEQQLSYPVRKRSPYKEHIAQKVSWLKESGIVFRTYRQWVLEKPKCLSSAQYFVSVRIQDFYPTLVVLGCGMIISVAVLIIEITQKKFHCLYK